MKKFGPLLVVGVIVIVLLAMLVPSYNGFVDKEENVGKAYAQVENQLQRRLDLIPNLVNTVKGYASQETDVIQSISDARAKLAGAETPSEQADADADLTGALNRLLVVVESYPDLKSNENFQQLADELAGTENRLAVARQDYNEEVATYNSSVKRFPGALIAKVFGFEEKEYFQSDEEADKAPTVDFGEAE